MASLSNRETNQKLFQEIKDISDAYFYALEVIKGNKSQFLSDIKKNNEEYQDFVRRVQTAFHSLDYVEQTFINNDFFYEAYAHWWSKIYSKSSYYRLRLKSMKHFKEAIDNAY